MSESDSDVLSAVQKNIYLVNNLNGLLDGSGRTTNPQTPRSIFVVNRENMQCSIVNYKIFQNIVASHLHLLDGSADQVERFNRSVMHYLIQVRKMTAKLPLEHQFSYTEQYQHIQRYLQQQSVKLGNDHALKVMMRPQPIEKLLKKNQVKPLSLIVRGRKQRSKASIPNRFAKQAPNKRRITLTKRQIDNKIRKYKNSTAIRFCVRNDIEQLVNYEPLETLCDTTCPNKEKMLKELFAFLETLYYQKAALPPHVVYITVLVNNVVCSFNLSTKMNLREIALRSTNVVHKRESGMLSMKFRKPYTTATIWSSGKITCAGANTEQKAIIATRRSARRLQQMGIPIEYKNIRIVNVLVSFSLPFGVRVTNFTEKYRKFASYEPELYPGVTYSREEIKANYKIFTTGSVTITVSSINMVQIALEHIFYALYEFRRPHNADEALEFKLRNDMPYRYKFC